jgi:hypothetical protein
MKKLERRNSSPENIFLEGNLGRRVSGFEVAQMTSRTLERFNAGELHYP